MKGNKETERKKWNKYLVLTHPGKGVVIMGGKKYDYAMYDILENNNTFEKLKKGPTLLKGKLQCFIRSFFKKNKVFFSENTYENIYLLGSQPSRLYGTHKFHKSFTDVHPLCLIVSSINSFNYNLAKYLRKLLQPKIPSVYITQDKFTFVKELEGVRNYNIFFSII